MLEYASKRHNERFNPNRKSYDLFINSCNHFMKGVLESADLSLPYLIDPRPNSYIHELRDDLIYTGTIYFDSDNSVWYSGPFKLVGTLKFSPDDRTDYIYWDGERLHLKDGSYLVAINPIPNL